jgi:hypothetical protein
MEMIGLAVIVILLALGIYFITRFSLSQPQELSQTQSLQQRQVSVSFINTLLSSDANCAGSVTFTTLLQNIADPSSTGILTCPDEDIVEYFNQSVIGIFEETLDVWNYKYEFSVIFPAGSLKDKITINHLCTEVLQAESSPIFPIPTDRGAIRVQMKICY